MKLELKHLAAYLPYKAHYWQDSHMFQIRDTITPENMMKLLDGTSSAKPILRSLSDLTADKVDMSDVHFQLFINKVKKGEAKYCNIIKLIEQHFDVFGLIDSGLAIDIKSINHSIG